MKLKACREEWEHNLTEVLRVPIIIGEFRKLYVIVRKRIYDQQEDSLNHYSLLRYVNFGGKDDSWDCSVDRRECSLEDCVHDINRCKDLLDMYKSINTH